uniref:Uncharacterized protein n=1 Tax=Noctiluca scintillans TaxID=2966 RepID=A0A7S1AEU3_NOCSC
MSTAHYGRAVPLALRRFVRLPCTKHVFDGPSEQLALPSGMPSGLHVVLLLSRRRHIEHADSWLSVREVWERLLAERALRKEDEMQMYICCLLPRFLPLRWIWRYRMRHWQQLLRDECPSSVHLLSTDEWSAGFHDRMGIHDDGRAYAMMIRNDGEILWASHDAFQEHLQEKDMVRIIKEEVQWRQDNQQALLGQAAQGTLAAPEESAEAAAVAPVDDVVQSSGKDKLA